MKLHIIGEEIFADSLRVARLTGEHQDIVRQLDTEIDAEQVIDLEVELGDTRDHLENAADDLASAQRVIDCAIGELAADLKTLTIEEIQEGWDACRLLLNELSGELEEDAKFYRRKAGAD